jgi:tetratricopeptide (TPR) repeat protein
MAARFTSCSHDHTLREAENLSVIHRQLFRGCSLLTDSLQIIMNNMRVFAGLICLASVMLSCVACGKSVSDGANVGNSANASTVSSNEMNGNASNMAPASGQALDVGKLDAEVARLEQEGEKNPDDETTLGALADAYVKRGAALYEAQRLADALRDYQSALKYSPNHEEANLRVAQITQEIGAEPHAEDGKPVAVPAKPGTNENQ